jgi:peptidoglycan hydrolase CwlO-like protein
MKQGVINMCRAAMVLETIKKTKSKGGMTSAQIKLAEAQSEDYADMKKEIQEIKNDVSNVNLKVDKVDNKVSNMEIQLAEIKGNLNILLENSKTKQKLIDNKYFWIFLTVFICLFAGVTHITELVKFLGG